MWFGRQLGECREKQAQVTTPLTKTANDFNALVEHRGALVSIHASVAGAADVSGPSLVPASAFYIGFGATGNYNKYNDWNVDATGYSNVYQGGELVQSGTAGGPPVDLDLDTSDSFTPQVQLGYFDHFTDSKWMWG
jgi:hypothetical protein